MPEILNEIKMGNLSGSIQRPDVDLDPLPIEFVLAKRL